MGSLIRPTNHLGNQQFLYCFFLLEANSTKQCCCGAPHTFGSRLHLIYEWEADVLGERSRCSVMNAI